MKCFDCFSPLCIVRLLLRKSFPVDEIVTFPRALLLTMWKKSGFVSRRRLSIFLASFFSFFFSLSCLFFSRCEKVFRTFHSLRFFRLCFVIVFFFIFFALDHFWLWRLPEDEHLFITLHLYKSIWNFEWQCESALALFVHLYSLECRLTVLACLSASIRAISGVVRVIFRPFT